MRNDASHRSISAAVCRYQSEQGRNYGAIFLVGGAWGIVSVQRGASCGATPKCNTHTRERTNRKENRTARLVWGELGGGGVRHVPRGDAELECFDYFISLKLGLERECDKNVIMSSLTLAHSKHVTNVEA